VCDVQLKYQEPLQEFTRYMKNAARRQAAANLWTELTAYISRQ